MNRTNTLHPIAWYKKKIMKLMWTLNKKTFGVKLLLFNSVINADYLNNYASFLIIPRKYCLLHYLPLSVNIIQKIPRSKTVLSLDAGRPKI